MSEGVAVRKEEAIKKLMEALWTAGGLVSTTELREITKAEIIKIERAWLS